VTPGKTVSVNNNNNDNNQDFARITSSTALKLALDSTIADTSSGRVSQDEAPLSSTPVSLEDYVKAKPANRRERSHSKTAAAATSSSANDNKLQNFPSDIEHIIEESPQKSHASNDILRLKTPEMNYWAPVPDPANGVFEEDQDVSMVNHSIGKLALTPCVGCSSSDDHASPKP